MTPGSSPRMRGKQERWARARLSLGLIPAHAGKTPCSATSRFGDRAHPRACGENGLIRGESCGGAGSSPRMRGKHHSAQLPQVAVGLIPAHAGKTRFPYPGWSARRAHPRACGENRVPRGGDRVDLGSSPRMRGKPAKTLQPLDVEGLIPAHAGKTDSLPVEL